jgi:hypothetical protein
MKLITTKTLTSAGNIEFTDIPQTFTDLYVVLSLRSARAVTSDDLRFRFNGDTGSNYTSRQLYGTGSGRDSTAGTTTGANLGPTSAATSTSNTFGNQALYISNYTGSTAKSGSVDSVSENNATEAYQFIISTLWSGTAPITSLTVYSAAAANLESGSTASLYGIGGVGTAWTPKATGGVISKIDGYYVHTFTSSGTFTPIANLVDVEYLVIAGGGSGAAAASGNAGSGGGGGAGGYRSSVTGESSGGGAAAESKLSLISGTPYTVTVGAGGAYVSIGNTNGNDGTASVFGSISSVGGGGGGRKATTGRTGGSGGAGGSIEQAGGSGTAGQGFAGSTGAPTVDSRRGGGGAGSIGGAAGGAGVSSSITGIARLRAGGGGGAAGDGSLAGGGIGGFQAGENGATAGQANTGSGGGGGADNTGIGTNGGAGGSGIVIVRYRA